MRPILSILIVPWCLIVGCHRSSSPSRPETSFAPGVLALVEGHAIRLADLEKTLEHRAHGRGGVLAQAEEREASFREMVNVESVYQRAKQAGFDQRPEIASQIKAFIAERFVREQMKDEPELPPISDAEIQEYYQGHASRFATPERVRFAIVQFGFPWKAADDKKAEVLRKAESILVEARALALSERGFGALARQHSEDQATRYVGGDAGWHSRGEASRWPVAVSEAAFALSHPGELGPVIRGSNGFYLVKLIEKKAAGLRPLPEVADAIRYQLGLEKRQRSQQQFYESMRAGLKIEINHALLESLSGRVTALAPDSTPPGLPGN